MPTMRHVSAHDKTLYYSTTVSGTTVPTNNMLGCPGVRGMSYPNWPDWPGSPDGVTVAPNRWYGAFC